MNWIHAYINAVKTNLPSSKREDIGEELTTLLEESLEEETGKTPSQLTEQEALTWLKSREHPALVATRYQERRALIDEDSFPLFKLVLRYVFIGLAVAYTALAILSALSSGNGEYVISVTRLVWNILHSCLLAFASITLVFHFFGKHFNARECLAGWNPRDLPDPDQKWEQEPYSSSIAGLAFTGIFLLFINGFLTGVVEGLADQKISMVNVQFAEQAAAMLPWINVVLIGSILLHGAMIVKPYWSTTTLAINIALCLGATIILYRLQDVAPLIGFVGEIRDNPEQFARLESLVSTFLRITFVIILATNLYEAARDAWRIARLGNRRPI